MATPSDPTPKPSVASATFDRAGSHQTVYLSGELDPASVPEIAEAIVARIEPGDERTWLDMSAVGFCDSSGLKMLAALHQRTSADGGLLVVCEPTPLVLRLLEVTGLADVIALRL